MFRYKPKRIIYRIVFPFTFLMGITTIFSWLFSAYIVTHYLDRNLEKQMEQVSGIISKSGFILNPLILQQLKEVLKADIVLSDSNGKVFNTTFKNSEIRKKLESTLRANPNTPFEDKNFAFLGKEYRTTVQTISLPERGQTLLSLWMPASEADRLKTRIIVGIGGISLVGIFAMAAVGYLIARTITAPVEKLVEVTAKVSEGDFTQRALIESKDEIGQLVHSFNNMIEKLQTFEKKLVENEKLATAGQMAAGFAHEIRNPLTSIRMLGQVIKNRIKNQPETQDMLHSMIKEIDRLDRTIQQMLNRTRPGELQSKWGDINSLIEDVLKVASEKLSAQQINLVKCFSENLPKIFMDEEKIKQVLWNLLLNAQEAMPKGGNLTVSTKKENNNVIEIRIEDSGIGISNEDTENLFQPFFTAKPEGMGLGLTMSRKIIEKHHGKILLASRPEGGTSVIVQLPTS